VKDLDAVDPGGILESLDASAFCIVAGPFAAIITRAADILIG
jgi:hypothetical protein